MIDLPRTTLYNERKRNTERNYTVKSDLKRGLSGSTLKLIALSSMLIDHTGAIVVLRMIRNRGGTTAMTAKAYQAFMSDYSWLVTLYDLMRLVGRLAFPLFCLLLVEGFLHTRHLGRYLRNLGLFALLSEPCFDLALNGTWLEFTSQNVFFTLFLGLLTLTGIRWVEQRFGNLHYAAAWLLKALVTAAGCLLAFLLRTDYAACGVLCIGLMYMLRSHRVRAFAAGCIPLLLLSSSQLFSYFALPLVGKYNGTRGISLKYVFYAFYPVHLLLLGFVAQIPGL